MGVDPVSLSLIVAASSAALSAGGAIYSGQQQKAAGNAAADQAEADAKAAAGQAQVEAGKVRAAARRQQSSALAALAASGVDVGTGTAEQIQADIGQRGEQDALTTILTGSNRAQAYEAQAEASRIGATNAGTAGWVNAGSSVLSSASKLSESQWRGLGIGKAPIVNRDPT